MRVNINGTWYDAEFVPIQIQLTEIDKENIKSMDPGATNYIVFPEALIWNEAREILKIESLASNPDNNG